MNKEQLVEKVVKEWSYRCEKGYPDLNNEKDLLILERLFGISLKEQEEEEQKSEVDKEEKYVRDVLLNAGVEEQRIQQALNSPYFRKAKDIDEFIKNLSTYVQAFKDFFDITKKGVGRGELIPLLSIKGSKSGGIADKDILVDGKVLEVKELDRGGSFITGKSGTAIGSTLKNNIRSFYEYGIDNTLVSQFDDPDFNEVVNSIKQYYEGPYSSGNLSMDFRKNILKFIKEFKDKKREIIDSVKNLKIVDVDGQKFTYTREGEGILRLGEKISDEKANLQKFLKHEYIIENSTPEEELDQIKDKYLDSIDFLLIYSKGGNMSKVLPQDQAKQDITVRDITQNSIRLKYKFK